MSKTEAELIQLRAENNALKALLAQHGIALMGRTVTEKVSCVQQFLRYGGNGFTEYLHRKYDINSSISYSKIIKIFILTAGIFGDAEGVF